MCCLFGLIDYGHSLTMRQKTRLIAALSVAAEARGTDATGIAYNSGGKLRVYKRPIPAHLLRLHIPHNAYAVMGHTRMTTQGDEKFNFNNHPFAAHVPGADFPLAHNGVLYNDETLRRQHKLPETHIQTDSYIAVQMLEHRQELSMESLAWMAEQLSGSFTFTVLDGQDNLYFIKGDNPFCLVHWPQLGVYVYASTKEILFKALERFRPCAELSQMVEIEEGGILRVDRRGQFTRAEFDTSNLYRQWSFYGGWNEYPMQRVTTQTAQINRAYIEELKAVAGVYGWDPASVDRLLAEGFTCEEIEEYLYESSYEGCLCEL